MKAAVKRTTPEVAARTEGAAANDNARGANPTILELPSEIGADRIEAVADILAEILVRRAMVALRMKPDDDQ